MARSGNQRVSDRYAPWLGTVALLIIVLASGVFLWTAFAGKDVAPNISPAALYAVRLTDSQGRSVSLGQWQGQVLLINFWATWCLPCREEIPYLMNAQRRYADNGVQIIGVAIDTADEVLAFSRDLGLDYPIFIDDSRGIALSKRLGNETGILPFTALINRQGKIIWINKGKLSPAQIDMQLKKLI